jgi:hypothetical protein
MLVTCAVEQAIIYWYDNYDNAISKILLFYLGIHGQFIHDSVI